VTIRWAGTPPADAHPGAVARLGTFVRQTEMVNGRPCYVSVERPDTMLWLSPNDYWSVGAADCLGTDISDLHSTQPGLALPDMITGAWNIADLNNEAWLRADNVQVAPAMPGVAAAGFTEGGEGDAAPGSGGGGVAAAGGAAVPIASGGYTPVVASDRLSIGWKDQPPADAYPGSVARLGVFVRLPHLINGMPCYEHEERPDTMLWFSPNKYWSIGLKQYLGTGVSSVHTTQTDIPLPDMITGTWNIANRRNDDWLTTNCIKVTALSPANAVSGAVGGGEAVAAAAAAAVTAGEGEGEGGGAATAAEGGSDSGEVASLLPAPSDDVGGATGQPGESGGGGGGGGGGSSKLAYEQTKASLEARVATARSVCESKANRRYHELIAPAFEDYALDRIDEAELKRRKTAAVEKVSSEQYGLAVLNSADGALEAALAAVAAAEEALEAALQTADGAAEKVEAALRTIEEQTQREEGEGGGGEDTARSG
jgi:hypothetical protein